MTAIMAQYRSRILAWHKWMCLLLITIFLSGSVIVFERTNKKRTLVHSSEGTILGHFYVPPITGWRKDLYHGNRLSNVKFSKKTKNAAVTAMLTVWKATDDNEKPTLKTLKTDIDSWLKYEKSKSNSAMSKTVVHSQSTIFRSWPGYSTHITRYKDSKVEVVKYLHFIYKTNKYMISVAVAGEPPFDNAIKYQEQAWQVMTKGLRVKDTNPITSTNTKPKDRKMARDLFRFDREATIVKFSPG